ncbi:MAG: class I SAM-dependent methyltransferase [Acidobacteriota bacterium]|nr:class I SAM-dependent methyltransferase [Acidobacteriota bacterium]
MDAVSTTNPPQKKAGREFWNSNPCGGQWASYREFMNWYHTVEPYMYDAVARHSWQGRRVLEVGCGQGPLANHLPSLGAIVVGMDMSDASLRRAAEGKRELGNDTLTLMHADAERLPFADASFDAVVSFGVLHHTPDTDGAVQEVRRVLKPGGTATVMLYRTGNPKWWATTLLRSWGHARDRRRAKRDRIADRARGKHGVNDSRGTALLELFGVPTLKAYSNREALAMFRGFSVVEIRNVQPGFRRMADIIPVLRAGAPVLGWIDRRFAGLWGFYQVIEARR